MKYMTDIAIAFGAADVAATNYEMQAVLALEKKLAQVGLSLFFLMSRFKFITLDVDYAKKLHDPIWCTHYYTLST